VTRIALDPKVLGAQEWLAPLGTLVPVVGRDTDPQSIQDCDAMVIRSITRVDSSLLQGSNVGFVGTTTIGFDHLDRDYLDRAGIAWTNAPGCNALAVADYVESSLAHWTQLHNRPMCSLTCGVIGVGGIGQVVAQRLSAMHAQVLLNDPPRHARGELVENTHIDELIELCDVICVHVPLITQGEHPTRHLLGADRLAKLRANQLLISAGRGAAIDNQALFQRLDQPDAPQVIMDVWENEPNILPELWPKTLIATPHIAGHALEGKLRGTQIVARRLAEHLGVSFDGPRVREVAEKMMKKSSGLPNLSWDLRAQQVYDVRHDDQRLRAALAGLDGPALAQAFDALRDQYPKRREIH